MLNQNNMKTRILIFALLFITIGLSAQESIRIISYNVENLFDTKHDTLKNDNDFLPDGKYHWTYERYKTKLVNLARVISNIGQDQTPIIVGLCEVENQKCLRDLLIYGGLRKYGYQFIHEESPDQRGIDCALLYNGKMFRMLDAELIAVPMPPSERPTRDLVYSKGLIGPNDNDTLHVFMCHFPSQLGGTEATAHKREAARKILQQAIDKILRHNPQADILVMGDMNASPADYLTGMHNLMLNMEKQGKGTHKWEGKWSCLDQFFVSDHLLNRATPHIYDADWIQETDEKFTGTEPKRTYKGGFQYQDGYSDHLPIYIDIKL